MTSAERADGFSTLLERWSSGDETALESILAEELPWIRGLVHERLGPVLRQAGDTHDYMQDAMLQVLRYGPRFVVADRRCFRALIARIVENTLRDASDRVTAKRRDVRRDFQAGNGSTDLGPARLDEAACTSTSPPDAASRNESNTWLRIALELLAPEDRRMIVLRSYEELEFHEIADMLGISTKAAQMRFARALPRLGRRVEALRSGRFHDALNDMG